MSVRLRSAFPALLLVLGFLGCPGPFPGHPQDPPPIYNHSQGATLQYWFQGTQGASGIGITTVGNFRYALVGTNRGLYIQSLDATSVALEVEGPTGATGPIQRDVEAYGNYAYVCSNATGPTQGVLVVDLSGLPAHVSVASSFLPDDGDPKAINLSIDATRGLLFLQRSQGVEIWDLQINPLHPVFVARLSQDSPVSDLVVQGTKLYVAEGSAKRFSIWEVSDPAQATMLARWSVQGFANSIWPREDGQAIGTVEETPSAPIKFWAVSAQTQVVPAGQWSLDGATLASSIKLKGDQAYIAYRSAGLIVLSLHDLSKPTLSARFDGPLVTLEPSLRDVRDVLTLGDPYPFGILVSDGTKGLVQAGYY